MDKCGGQMTAPGSWSFPSITWTQTQVVKFDGTFLELLSYIAESQCSYIEMWAISEQNALSELRN